MVVCGQLLSPAQFYDSEADACAAVAVCASPAVLNAETNRCDCPDKQIYDGGACVAPSGESCGGLSPAQFYDWAVRECVANCPAPSVPDTGTNRCECPSGYSGDSVVCNADVTVSFSSPANGALSAASGGGAIQDGETVVHGATVTFTAEPARGYEVSIWTGVCAGAVGVSCEAVATADVSAGVEFFEAGGESCGRLIPAKVYDAAARGCVANCPAPSVPNTETNRCECPPGYSGDGGVCNADVTVSFSSPANGTLSAASGGGAIQNGGTVVHGATVTFTASPASGYEVSIWTGGCAGAVGVSCEAVATADVVAGVEFFFEAGAESCGGLIPAQFYDAAAKECVAFATCDLPEVRNAETNLCECLTGYVVKDGKCEVCPPGQGVLADGTCGACPAEQVIYGGVCAACGSGQFALDGVCVAASAESCRGLTPAEVYDLNADACVAASEDVCKGLTPEEFYDATARECVAVAVCASPAVRNAETNLCECPLGYSGDGGVCNADVTVSFSSPANGTLSAASGGGAIQNGVTVAHGTTVTFTASPASGYEVSIWTGVCAGAVGVFCEAVATADVSAGVEFFEAGAESCGRLIPAQFYDAAAKECVAVAAGCDLPAVRRAGTNLCDCPAPNIGDDGAVAPGVCAAPSADVCGRENQFYAVTVFHGTPVSACVEFVTCETGATLNSAENRCECAGAAVLDGAGTGCLCESPNEGTPESCAAPSADVCGGLTPEEFYDADAGACVAAAVCASPAVRNAGTNLCECPLGYSGDGAVCNADVTVSFSSPANGGLSAASGGGAIQNGGTVAHGTTVTFTAEPARGYEVSIWTGVCAGAVGVFCEAVATADVSAGVEFFEAGAESCKGLSPAKFYDSAAGACVAVAVCTSPAVLDGAANLCNCPSPNIGTNGAAAPGDCAVPAPSVEVCRGLSPSQLYDAAADACVAASVEVCEGLIPSQFYDAAARECAAVAECDLPSVRNAGTNLCDCPAPNIGENGAVAPGVCAAPSAEVCGGENQFYAVTVFHGASLAACVEFVTCEAGATLNRAENGCECAGAATLNGAGTGCLCESPNEGTPGACAAPSAEVCGGLTPEEFYDSTAGACVAAAVCASPAVRNAETNLCECPLGYSGDGGVCNADVTVSFSSPANGGLSAASGGGAIQNGGTVAHGTTVTFTASPASGYEVSIWTGVCAGAVGVFCEAVATADVSAGVEFFEASAESCGRLIPAQFYDAAAKECVAVAAGCDLPAVRRAGTNLCDCPAPNIGDDGAVAPGVCAAPSADVCGRENQFYAVTVFHGTPVSACVEFVTCETGATLNSAENRCECAGAADAGRRGDGLPVRISE